MANLELREESESKQVVVRVSVSLRDLPTGEEDERGPVLALVMTEAYSPACKRLAAILNRGLENADIRQIGQIERVLDICLDWLEDQFAVLKNGQGRLGFGYLARRAWKYLRLAWRTARLEVSSFLSRS